MSIFSTANLAPVAESVDNTVIDIDSISNDFTEISFFESACDFLTEMHAQFNNNSKILYRSLLENSTDQVIITESFNEFFDKAKEIINKILEFIKKLFNKFIIMINKLFSSDKYLKKHIKDLDKFKDGQDNFDISNAFEYTFKPDVPAVQALEDFSSEFVFGADGAKAFKEALDKIKDKKKEETDFSKINSDVIDVYKKHYEKLINELEDGDYYDKFRARVLNKSTDHISESDYADELFSEYRDGTSDSSDITVDRSYIRKATDRFNQHEKVVKQVKKQKLDVEKEYKNLKNKIDELQSTNYKDNNKCIRLTFPGEDSEILVPYTSELLNAIDVYLKAKCNQVEQISNIHTLAFSAKLDAITACFKQDKNVLYRALQKINGFTHEGCSLIDLGSEVTSLTDITYPGKLEDINNIDPAQEINFSYTADILKNVELK